MAVLLLLGRVLLLLLLVLLMLLVGLLWGRSVVLALVALGRGRVVAVARGRLGVVALLIEGGESVNS